MKNKNKVSNNKQKECSVCGRKIKVVFNADKTYSGGYYFGKIPLTSKKEMKRVMKSGLRKTKLGNRFVDVLKEEPKAFAYGEYWECQKCYHQ